jgi:glycosyltransferase involved in cell wall biosynthesis
MKICIVTPDIVGPIKNGGIGTHCHYLCELLKEHELTVLFTARPEKVSAKRWRDWFSERNIRLVVLGELSLPQPLAPFNPEPEVFFDRSWRCYQWLREQNFEYIHFQDWGGNGFFSIRAKRTGIGFTNTTLAVTMHSSSEWQRQGMGHWPEKTRSHYKLNRVERYCCENADQLISPSRHMVEWAREQGWRIPADAKVMPCPFVRHQKEQSLSPVDFSHLIFFGRLETRKGLDVFCKALTSLFKESGNSGIQQVSFVGKPGFIKGEGALEYLRRFNDSIPSGIKVTIHDKLDSHAAVAFLVSAGGIVFIPSLVDNCPFTVLECIENHIPFFCARSGGIPDLVDERCLFDPDVDSLKQLISSRETMLQPWEHRYNAEQANRAWLDIHRLEQQPGAVPDSVREDLLISVCIPHYNHLDFLPQAIKGITSGDYRNFEIIIVDDGSTDPRAAELLRRYETENTGGRIKVIRHAENQGLGATRNTAVEHAKGDWVYFNDADNVAFPELLSTYAKAFQSSRADCLTCGFLAFRSEAYPVAETRAKYTFRPYGDFGSLGLLDNVMGDAGFGIRKKVFQQLGGFSATHDFALGDWEFLLRLCLKGCHLDVIPEPLYWYRHMPGSMLRSDSRYHSHRHLLQAFLKDRDEAEKDLLLNLLIPLNEEHSALEKLWMKLDLRVRKLLAWKRK